MTSEDAPREKGFFLVRSNNSLIFEGGRKKRRVYSKKKRGHPLERSLNGGREAEIRRIGKKVQ